MRVFGIGLLVAISVSFAAPSFAERTGNHETPLLQFSPKHSTDLGRDIPLTRLISPSMQWSQMEMDSLKAEGLNSSLPYAYTAELVIKSDMIRSYKSAEEAQVSQNMAGKYRPINALLILLAGLTMWCGLSFQRKH